MASSSMRAMKLCNLRPLHRALFPALQRGGFTTLTEVTPTPNSWTKDDQRDFKGAFPDVVRDLTEIANIQGFPEVKKWLSKTLQYNVPGGKNIRGLTTMYTFKTLADPKNQTPDNIHLSHVLGWCVELCQGYFLVIDDFIDASETRRGRPCWYKVPDVGVRAINDGQVIKSCIFQLLRKHFGYRSFYTEVTDLFNECIFKTELGQHLDHISSLPDPTRFSLFTMERYKLITEYKTAYYSFYLPVATGMHLAGFGEPQRVRLAKSILLDMGHFFQVQDDYLDLFGESSETGKVGSDIANGKCTWLAVVALQRATPSQRALFESSYGDPEKVDIVKGLYEELCLPKVFKAYEEESFNLLTERIQMIPRGMSDEIFFTLLYKLFRRNK